MVFQAEMRRPKQRVLQNCSKGEGVEVINGILRNKIPKAEKMLTRATLMLYGARGPSGGDTTCKVLKKMFAVYAIENGTLPRPHCNTE